MALVLHRSAPNARSRARAAAVTVGAFAASLAYLVGAYIVVFSARIGPVAHAFDPEGGHGVHAGDMLALPLLALAVVMFVMGVAACDEAVRVRQRMPWRVSVG